MAEHDPVKSREPKTDKSRMRGWDHRVDWYKKRRDEVPVRNRANRKRNPFESLLKSNEQD